MERLRLPSWSESSTTSDWRARGWWDLVAGDGGAPLLIEEIELLPEDVEVGYSEKAILKEERVAPPGTYDVPHDYRPVKFNPGCMRVGR